MTLSFNLAPGYSLGDAVEAIQNAEGQLGKPDTLQASPPEQAIHEAAVLRFRPIMMTTMSALFVTLPIAVGFGAGSDLRQPLGVAVVGGLIVSQALTLFTTPVTYLYIERFSAWISLRIAWLRRSRPQSPTPA